MEREFSFFKWVIQFARYMKRVQNVHGNKQRLPSGVFTNQGIRFLQTIFIDLTKPYTFASHALHPSGRSCPASVKAHQWAGWRTRSTATKNTSQQTVVARCFCLMCEVVSVMPRVARAASGMRGTDSDARAVSAMRVQLGYLRSTGA